jgi:hypothetical protein
MHRFINFIMGVAIVALALAVVSISAVAVMAQTMALLSQCLLALGMIGVGLIVASSMALRNRVIQVYLARRLLGVEADQVLAEHKPDRVGALPEMFPPNHMLLPAERASIQTTPAQGSRRSVLPALPVMPAVPQGWGFDEED